MIGAARVELKGNDAPIVGDFPAFCEVSDDIEVLVKTNEAGADGFAIHFTPETHTNRVKIYSFSFDGNLKNPPPFRGLGVGCRAESKNQ